MIIFASISYLNLLPFQIFIKKKINNTQIKQIMLFRRSIPSANQEVYSVFALNGKQSFDIESDTSNALCKVLNIKGQVLIGDKALKYYLNGAENYKDLSLEWYKTYNLPFVFARLCYNKNGTLIKKITKKFLSKKIRIPQYYLKKEANKRGITQKELLWYLNNIYYKIGYKEEKSLKLFLKKKKQRD